MTMVVLLSAHDSSAQNRKDYEIRKVEQPIILRSFVKDGPARAINVGLPGNNHFCFDAELPRVVFAWSGDFLDIGPDRGYGKGRGGKHAIPLGKKYKVGDSGFPFLVGNKAPKSIEFNGYRRLPHPTFYYTINKSINVAQTIKSNTTGEGLTYLFQIKGASQKLQFKLDSKEVTLNANKGKVSNGVLSLSAADAKKFNVTISPAAQKSK